MVAPFYNAIKGTTAGTPGTGAFTPNAASAGYRAWSTVPNWIGLVRYEDGSAWELSYSYWDGSSLSRGTNQRVDSSTGSALSLTSSATAAMIIDAAEVMPDVGGSCTRSWKAIANSTTVTADGMPSASAIGTAAAAALATTNYLTEQVRIQYTSATTASANAGVFGSATAVYSTTVGRGGFEMVARFGASQLPTAPRLMVGMFSASQSGTAAEASAINAAFVQFGKDSTDTNIQLITNNAGASSGTKTDTGIPLVANGWYETSLWVEPGGGKLCGLLVRLDTGAIWYGETTSDLPPSGALVPHVMCGLNATNTGTAAVLHVGQVAIRTGA